MGRGSWCSGAGRLGLFFTWPVRVVLQALRLNSKQGRRAYEISGKGRCRQLIEALFVAARHFLPVRHYYFQGMYRRRDWGFALRCLSEFEMGDLFNRLNGGARLPVINDKQAFAKWCAANELPSPRLIATASSGNWNNASPKFASGESWFVKPICGSQGKGTERWDATKNGKCRNQSGLEFSVEELLQRLAQRSREGPLLVQACYENHPKLTGLSNGALASVRMVTGRWPDGRIELVAALFTMPTGSRITSNLGISSPIDLSSGKLGPGYSYSPFLDPVDTHPDTGETIVGLKVPRWQELRELALKAHAKLERYVFVGWDVAVTDEGPLLLEGNANWDVLMIQKAHQQAITEFSFGPIAEAWLTSKAQAD